MRGAFDASTATTYKTSSVENRRDDLRVVHHRKKSRSVFTGGSRSLPMSENLTFSRIDAMEVERLDLKPLDAERPVQNGLRSTRSTFQ